MDRQTKKAPAHLQMRKGEVKPFNDDFTSYAARKPLPLGMGRKRRSHT